MTEKLPLYLSKKDIENIVNKLVSIAEINQENGFAHLISIVSLYFKVVIPKEFFDAALDTLIEGVKRTSNNIQVKFVEKNRKL